MWGFGSITNGSGERLMVNYSVDPGVTTTGGALNSTMGNAMIELGGLGALYFTDAGGQPGGPFPWAVDVQHNDTTWRWYYEGVGTLEVEIGMDGAFTLRGLGQEYTGVLKQPPAPSEGLAGLIELNTPSPEAMAAVGVSPEGVSER